MHEALESFVRRAGFIYGLDNLESWARRMAEQAVRELAASPADRAELAAEAKRLADDMAARDPMFRNGVRTKLHAIIEALAAAPASVAADRAELAVEAKRRLKDFARACAFGSDDSRIEHGRAIEAAIEALVAQPKPTEPSGWRCTDGAACPSEKDCKEFDFCGREPAEPSAGALPELRGAHARLRDSIAWLRDGKPVAKGIGVADMVLIERALAATETRTFCNGLTKFDETRSEDWRNGWWAGHAEGFGAAAQVRAEPIKALESEAIRLANLWCPTHIREVTAAIRALAAAAQAPAIPQEHEQALKLLRHFDKYLGTVLQEHQFNVPGGGSLAAHNVRLGLIELHKFLAPIPEAGAAE